MWHIYGLLLLASFALLRADDCGDNAIEKCDSFAFFQTSSVLLKAKDRTKNLGLEEQPAKTLMASSEAQESVQEQPAAKPTPLTGSRQSSQEQLIESATSMNMPTPAPGSEAPAMKSSGLSLPLLGDATPQHPWMWVQGKPVVEFLLGHTATKALIDVYGSEEHGDQKADPTPSQGDPQTSTREPTIGEQYAFTHETEVPTNRVQLIVSLAIWSCLVLLVAKFFKREEGDTPPEDEKRVKRTNEEMQQWSSGAFDCFQSLPLCIASLCCPLVVFADTMASVHVVNFWLILLCLVALAWLDLLILPLFVWMLTCLVMVFYRHKLRAKFDMAHYTFSTIAGDFLGYCMCFPCFISQEARHVEEAVFSGHSAVKALEEKEPAEDAA
eukprot:gnl/TRDRNA2_/TRDRNA2_168516_c0_seq4.p1 gnl/TRDRNA2_/TRDRNA2_168516_c0~~gnl/TRDRNA2_/TRDRNA2_168516_c0_seq4.p1  ORF type:complete len:383 (+),score=83.31 gnl/TRDRNA2_/TRDRNA2_168516_c0_seq4:70-1218(+)